MKFRHYSESSCKRIGEPFCLKEIKEAVWLSKREKIHGPNGFNMGFFKKCWVMLQDDLVSFVNEFHVSAKLPKAITSGFLTLVPKVDNPQDIS